MHRLRFFAAIAVAGILSGCGGEDQPNKPIENPTAADGVNVGNMMQKANSGMDPKKVKSAGGAPKAPTPTPAPEETK